jgi:hypothetical protein
MARVVHSREEVVSGLKLVSIPIERRTGIAQRAMAEFILTITVSLFTGEYQVKMMGFKDRRLSSPLVRVYKVK